MQVELNRAIYMDERRRERSERFSDVIDDFALLAEALAEVPLDDLRHHAGRRRIGLKLSPHVTVCVAENRRSELGLKRKKGRSQRQAAQV
ncbi:MAG: hypothetical protein MZV49_04255 [Rhodopseudomonas palustris]|nr:hypothetical protein [Rhodopseudomonas palustris]